jgi:acetylornithine deacetylase/succinyl-diaminopimelate desuccinylase-like protein
MGKRAFAALMSVSQPLLGLLTVNVGVICDAAVLSAAGIPSVVFGPGDVAQAHTADEWILVSQLEHAREMLVRFLKSLP